MKLTVLLALFSILICAFARSNCLFQDFDKSEFYKIMEEGKMDEIDNELSHVAAAVMTEKEAYTGALMMRKSGLLTSAAQKLKFFKQGRIKLETALAKDSSNTEYHFLRLIIQEHSPKIVNYRNELEIDKKQIRRSFPALPAVVKQAIMNYSRKSTVVHPEDL